LNRRVEQVQRVAHVGAKIFRGHFHALACLNQRGKMKHRLGFAGVQRGTNVVNLRQIAMNKLRLGWHGIAMALAQVVKNSHAVPRLNQHLRGHTANVSGTAGNKNVHGLDDSAKRAASAKCKVLSE